MGGVDSGRCRRGVGAAGRCPDATAPHRGRGLGGAGVRWCPAMQMKATVESFLACRWYGLPAFGVGEGVVQHSDGNAGDGGKLLLRCIRDLRLCAVVWC